MIRFLQSSVVITASLAATSVFAAPGVAHAADTTTRLSATAMTAALKKVSETSAAAADEGLRASIRTAIGKQPLAGLYVVDPAAGVASSQTRLGNQRSADYAVEGKGVYVYVNDATAQAALKMIGRPSVRYAFVPKTVKLDAYVAKNIPTPAIVLTKDVDHAGTKTTHDDGSTDFRYTADRGVNVALHVDGAGTLTSVRGTSAKTALSLAFRYGAQHVILPTASMTVDGSTLRRAVAYLSMPTAVKGVADKGAADTRRAAAGATVKVSSLRTIVRRDAAALTAPGKAGVQVKVADIDGGASVAATNPWTHETVSYAVTASGREVRVARS